MLIRDKQLLCILYPAYRLSKNEPGYPAWTRLAGYPMSHITYMKVFILSGSTREYNALLQRYLQLYQQFRKGVNTNRFPFMNMENVCKLSWKMFVNESRVNFH